MRVISSESVVKRHPIRPQVQTLIQFILIGKFRRSTLAGAGNGRGDKIWRQEFFHRFSCCLLPR